MSRRDPTWVVFVRTPTDWDAVQEEVIAALKHCSFLGAGIDDSTCSDVANLMSMGADSVSHRLDRFGVALVAQRDGEFDYKDVSNIGVATHLVVPHPAMIASSIGDVADFVERLTGSGVTVHFSDVGSMYRPGASSDRLEAWRAAADTESRLAERDAISEIRSRRAGRSTDKWSGRPPFGFEVKDGKLVEGDDFIRIVATLKLVEAGDLTKSAAADELDTSRRTIDRCLQDRRSMYQVD